ncbi:hypothetical protein C367_00775 [Cryptococcus neoformans Ze90-1]|nr:hypothetical protein C367_00775 [Cryptococcus neoformans var. grubii Ze90-1]
MIFAQLRTLLLLLASHLVLTTTTLAHTDHPGHWAPQPPNPADTLWASTNIAAPIVTQEQHIPQPNIVPIQLSREPQQFPTNTETIDLPTSQPPQGVPLYAQPLSIILIFCAVLGFISTFTTSPFSFQMSSSSSKPPGSSSSSSTSKPSSSSSSPSSAPKPSSPQPVPTISANAWMSFFLFCCLVLIILQGPLGLTGGGALPGVAQWTQWPKFGGGGGGGGGWWTGWDGLGLGGAPGCVGVVAGMVPWCQPQVQQPPPQPPLVPPLSQVQIQQIVQNPPLPPHYQSPRQRIVSHQPPAGVGAQMGGQGGFATPEGGGGWSWYANGPSSASPGAVRQYTDQYYPPQQRSVQYQRPGLQLQVSTGPQQPVFNHPYTYTYPQHSQYRCTIYQPWFCAPTFAYAQSYSPGGVGTVYEPARAYAYRYQQPYSYVLGHRHYPHRHHQNGQLYPDHPQRHVYAIAPTYGYQYQQTGPGGNIQAQVQGQGQPISVVHPSPQQAIPCPPQAVPAPQGVTPNPFGGLANLDNAFYPLLVGAIALFVIFDYMS